MEQHLYRRKAIRKAPGTHKNPDREMRKKIPECAALHPDCAVLEIAQHLDVGIGRVSGVLRGKRGQPRKKP